MIIIRFFFPFTKIYNILQYRQFLSNTCCKFFKNEGKDDYVCVWKKIHFDNIYLKAAQVLFYPHIFMLF